MPVPSTGTHKKVPVPVPVPVNLYRHLEVPVTGTYPKVVVPVPVTVPVPISAPAIRGMHKIITLDPQNDIFRNTK